MTAGRIHWTIWLFGPFVWAAHFFLLYGITSFACGPSDASRQVSIRLMSLALTAIALAALAGFLASQLIAGRGEQRNAAAGMPAFLGRTAKSPRDIGHVRGRLDRAGRRYDSTLRRHRDRGVKHSLVVGALKKSIEHGAVAAADRRSGDQSGDYYRA